MFSALKIELQLSLILLIHLVLSFYTLLVLFSLCLYNIIFTDHANWHRIGSIGAGPISDAFSYLPLLGTC